MAERDNRFNRSIDACIENSRQLLEDAEVVFRPPTKLALAMLAQEECAKAFVLTLVRDQLLPWTKEVRRSLKVHDCKHLVSIIMEWLQTVSKTCEAELFARLRERKDLDQFLLRKPKFLPPDVATAVNIYRHEKIEQIAGRSPERVPEWRGVARKRASGQRDRRKQSALYVEVNAEGDVSSHPSASETELNTEIDRAETLIQIADAGRRGCVFAHCEYRQLGEILRAMFEDLTTEQEDEEVIDSGIPGVVFVRRRITTATVVRTDDDDPRTCDEAGA